tara:strand:+ start:64 stop:1224 length:1161 start_codon:yes stop_codon:yes gene_type:complete
MMGNLPSDYKETEAKAFQEAAKWGQEKLLKTVGDYKPNKEFFLSYPLARAKNPKAEDSFLIQAVEYLPPGKGEGLGIESLGDTDLLSGNKAFDTYSAEDEKKNKNNIAGTIKKGQLKVLGKFSGAEMGQRVDKLKKKTKFYVELPIPKQVNDGNSCVWSGNSMNLFTLAGLDLATGLMSQPLDTLGDIQTIIDNLVKGADFDSLGLGSGDEAQNAIRASLAGLAINQFGGGTTPNSVMSRGMGKILNSNKELLFDGVNLREFKFDFTFTPRSYDEGLRAKTIIRSLKMAMAPKRGEQGRGGVLINAPNLFLLQYRSGGKPHPFLNSFKPCALTSFAVNYTGSGTYATYGAGTSDSTPVHMKVAMTFKETNPIYEEDYTDVPNGVGY